MSDTSGFAYTIRRLSKIYLPARVQANREISFDVPRGEIFGIFGPNGAGKTTLVKQMAGLLRPTSGEIHLFERDAVRDPDLVPTTVSYYGQKVLALRAHRVREVIMHTAVLRGESTADARRITEELIEKFDLGHIADRMMLKLSGGQQRQAALLASLAGYRPVIILDEPTNELDPSMRKRVWDHLWTMNADRGTTIILVTHNVLEAEQVVERVAIIDRGILAALGTPGELKRRVDSSVRVEVRLKHGCDDGRLGGIAGAVRIREGRYRITAHRDRAESLFRSVLGSVGMRRLDDFRLITPSLEDIYLRYTREQHDGEAGTQ